MTREQPYRHGDVHAAALRAARALIDEEGTGALSLRAVARRVGVSHAALYRHFADRDALLAELGVDALTQLAEELAAARAKARTPIGLVEAMGRAYFRFALREPGRYRVAFVLPRKTDFPALRAAADTVETAALDILQEVATAGLIARRDIRTLAPVLWALLHGMSLLAIDGQLTEGEIAVAKGNTRAIERALLTSVRRLLATYAP